jgi:hypothetical protein
MVYFGNEIQVPMFLPLRKRGSRGIYGTDSQTYLATLRISSVGATPGVARLVTFSLFKGD